MLDSRASVHLARGKPQQAIADLTAAIREKPTPVRRFHLAQAYEMAGKRPEAAETIRQALGAGLSEDELHPLERPAFARLKKLAE
jgi:predicted Zn-dependent protease